MLDPRIFKEDPNYLEYLGSGVWLMDNHKWALYVWEKSRLPRRAYTLVHVDYHWDAIYKFEEYPVEEARLKEASCNQLESLIRKGKLIGYDSFIGPAMARGLVDNIHFLCFQEESDKGFSQRELEKFGCTQTVHNDSDELRVLEISEPLLFDLCLDVFNRSDYEYRSDLWGDAEIAKLLDDCKALVERAAVVTVSMSYGCSGTAEDTRRLTERVIPLFLEWRKPAR